MVPMVLQNLIVQTVMLADTIMVGMLGEQYLAAVTVAMTPLFLFMIFTFGVQSGVGILVAQYWGKGDTNTINRILGVGLFFSTVVILAGSMVLFFFPEQILGLITSESHLVPLAAQYTRIAAFASVLGAISMVYISCHRSMENPRLGFFVLAASSLFNVFANWALIFGRLGMPALGIEGAAIASVLTRALEVVIILIYASRNKRLPLKLRLLFRPGMMIFRDFVKYSFPVLLNEILWGFGFMLYPVILGHMYGAGTILAAHTIAGNVERMFAVAVFACAGATSIIIGRELGAGRTDNIERTAKSLVALALILGLASGALLMLARFTVLEPFVFPLFVLSPAASAAAATMITILACVIPLRTMGITIGLGILRGGGDVKALMYIDVGTLYLVSLPIAATSGLVLGLGVAFVYSGFLVEDVVKTTLLLWRLRSKKWIHNVTREKIE